MDVTHYNSFSSFQLCCRFVATFYNYIDYILNNTSTGENLQILLLTLNWLKITTTTTTTTTTFLGETKNKIFKYFVFI